MSKKNVNEKGIVLPETKPSEVEAKMEEERKKEVIDRKAEIEQIKEVAQKVPIEGNFVELMEKYNITTLVPIAKVVNIAPQQLYSRRKRDKETGEYKIGEGVERAALRAALQNTDMTTMEEVMQAARKYLDEKEAIKKERQATKTATKKKEGKKVINFKEGDKVEYSTHRAVNGVKEYYVRKGTIVGLMEEGTKAKIKTDDGADVEIRCRHLRLQDTTEE